MLKRNGRRLRRSLNDYIKGERQSSPTFSYQEATYDSVFGSFDYGQHWMVLGDIDTGKSNLMLFFHKYSPHRCIFFNIEGMIEPRKLSHVDLTEDDIYDNALMRALEEPSFKKICITPSDKHISEDKALFALWNNICETTFSYKDKLYSEIMKRRGFKESDFYEQALIVLINDETIECMQNEEMVRFHKAIMIRGRKRGISTMSATQRQQNISKQLTTKTHKIMFYLDDYDIFALKGKVSGIEYTSQLERFCFVRKLKGQKNLDFFRPCEHIILSRADLWKIKHSEVKK